MNNKYLVKIAAEVDNAPYKYLPTFGEDLVASLKALGGALAGGSVGGVVGGTIGAATAAALRKDPIRGAAIGGGILGGAGAGGTAVTVAVKDKRRRLEEANRRGGGSGEVSLGRTAGTMLAENAVGAISGPVALFTPTLVTRAALNDQYQKGLAEAAQAAVVKNSGGISVE